MRMRLCRILCFVLKSELAFIRALEAGDPGSGLKIWLNSSWWLSFLLLRWDTKSKLESLRDRRRAPSGGCRGGDGSCFFSDFCKSWADGINSRSWSSHECFILALNWDCFTGLDGADMDWCFNTGAGVGGCEMTADPMRG